MISIRVKSSARKRVQSPDPPPHSSVSALTGFEWSLCVQQTVCNPKFAETKTEQSSKSRNGARQYLAFCLMNDNKCGKNLFCWHKENKSQTERDDFTHANKPTVKINQTKLPSSPCGNLLTVHVFSYVFAARPPETEPTSRQSTWGNEWSPERHILPVTHSAHAHAALLWKRTASRRDLRWYAKRNANTGERRGCVCLCPHARVCACPNMSPLPEEGFQILPSLPPSLPLCRRDDTDWQQCLMFSCCVVRPLTTRSPAPSILLPHFSPSSETFFRGLTVRWSRDTETNKHEQLLRHWNSQKIISKLSNQQAQIKNGWRFSSCSASFLLADHLEQIWVWCEVKVRSHACALSDCTREM